MLEDLEEIGRPAPYLWQHDMSIAMLRYIAQEERTSRRLTVQTSSSSSNNPQALRGSNWQPPPARLISYRLWAISKLFHFSPVDPLDDPGSFRK
jgi:hypothetical protein